MKKLLMAALLLGGLSACAATEPAYAQAATCVSVEQFEKGENLKDWFTIHTEGTGMTVELFAPDGAAASEVVMVLFDDSCFKQKLSRQVPLDLPLNAALNSGMDINVH